MSLRTRLFLFFGGLVTLLVGAEWALVSALADDLEEEVGEVAFEVGSGVLGAMFPRIVQKGGPHTDVAYAAQAEYAEEDGVDHEDAADGTVDWTLDDLDIFRAPDDRRPHTLFAVGPREGRGFDVRSPRRVLVRQDVHFRREVRRFSPPGVRVGAFGERDARGTVEFGKVLRIVVGSAGIEPFGEGGGLMILGMDEGQFEFDFDGEIREAVEEFSGIVSLQLADAGEVFEHEQDEPFWFDDDRDDDDRGWIASPVAPAVDAPRLSGPQDGTAAAEPVAHEIPIPRAGFDTAVETFLSRLWLGSIAIFGLGVLVAGYVAHRVTGPLRRLSRAARDVGEGALGTQVPQGGDQEVAETIGAFNQMSTRLAALDAEARELREREHLTEIGEVARGLAHAMRNPLHMLGLSVEQLAAGCTGGPGEAQSAAMAETARRQIQRVDRSLRSFLSLTSGGGEIEDVDGVDLVRDVVLELMQDGAGGAALRVEASEPCSIAAVAPELRAVLQVLVVNAVEASPAGGEVVVRVACEGERVRFEVSDRGPGLAPRVRERLFTPHLTTKEQGAGMGLFLAQRIATSRYGGSLELADRAGGGTCATLVVHDRGGEQRD